ncbi:unnamed protein product [Closterium sp. Naga37s-1]|nr:unnamed protein product [Closterium sp. Naga37s-1]
MAVRPKDAATFVPRGGAFSQRRCCASEHPHHMAHRGSKGPKGTTAAMPRDGEEVLLGEEVLCEALQQSCQGVVLLREVTWTTWLGSRLPMAVRPKDAATVMPKGGSSESRAEAAMAAEATTGSARKSMWGFRCSRCGCGNSINVLAVPLKDRRGGGEEAEREGRGKKRSGHPEATTPATIAIAVVAMHI